MVSAKLLAFLPLFGSIAAAAAATSATTNSADDFDLEVYKAEALLSPEVAIWPGVDADLKLLFPGVTCQLTTGNTTTTKRAAPNADCQTIEENLVSIFPTIQCSGEIDWAELEVNFERLQQTTSLEARQNRHKEHVDDHHARSLREVATAESKTITSCASATRPGNCRICAAGYAVAAVSEIGVCAAAAYAAAAASAGVLAAPAWAAFTACGAAAIANLVASLTGCWSR